MAGVKPHLEAGSAASTECRLFCSGKTKRPSCPKPNSFHRVQSSSRARSVVCRDIGIEGGNGNGGKGGCKHLGGGGNGDWQGRAGEQLLLWASCLAVLSFARPAHALFGRRRKKPSPRPREVDRWVDLSWPVLKNLGFSGVLGVLAAFAFKTVGLSLAVGVGLVFGFIQMGAYLGYVKVDWAKVHKDVLRHFDVNRDGVFDASDLKAATASCLAILSQGVPSIGGFYTGFFWGLSL